MEEAVNKFFEVQRSLFNVQLARIFHSGLCREVAAGYNFSIRSSLLIKPQRAGETRDKKAESQLQWEVRISCKESASSPARTRGLETTVPRTSRHPEPSSKSGPVI